MKKKALLIILGVVLLVLPLTGCASAITQKQLTDALAPYALKADIKGYATTGALSDLGESIQVQLEEAGVGVITQEEWDLLLEEVANLQGENSTLRSQVTALQDDVANLKGNGSSPNGTTPDGEYLTTRWTVDAEFDPILDSGDYEVDMSWYPTRIGEEDTYRFTLDVTAIGAQGQVDVDSLWISFSPTSRDTSVDTSNTGIYSVSPIGIWWDAEYSPSDGVDCRSMTFVSDDFEIPYLDDTETFTLRFDFDLYYQH